jgi:hypothetical protein
LTSQTISGSPGSDQPIILANLDADKKLADWVTNQYKSIKAARNQLEVQWYQNLAFFFGRQWVQFVSTAASVTGVRLTTPPAPPWRVRLVINKIRPIIRTELAKTTSKKPQFSVMPRSTDDVDLVASRVSDQILKCEYDEKNIQEIIKSAAWWALLTGTGFIKDYWNPKLKDRNGNVGDFAVESVTPFHLFVPDLKTEDIEKQPFVIHASTMGLDVANAQFGNKFNQNDVQVSATQDLLNDSFLNLAGSNNAQKSQELLFLECWIKPGWHPQFPNGGMVTVCGNKIVVKKDMFPFKHGEYPFSKIIHIPAGRFYGVSVIEDLIPVQREYNRTRSQVIESKNKMSKPQLLAQEGSITPGRVTSEPGQIITYKVGYQPPTPLQLQGIPGYVGEEIQRLQMDFDDISGQHEISRGGTPSQVTAATAISFLQEQDDTKLSHTVTSIENSVAKLGRHILTYAADYWTEPRLIRVIGDDGSFDASLYKGSEIRGNNDVIVEAGSGLPTSKAAKQAFIMDLIKLGIIPPEKALEMLDIGGIEKVYQEVLIDRRQAQRENLQMSRLNTMIVQAMQSAGQETGADIHTWDNHALHITTHNNFRKSQQFSLLPPETKAVFEAHVQAHQAMIQQQQIQDAQMQMQLAGQQPGLPTQSGGGSGGPTPDSTTPPNTGGV